MKKNELKVGDTVVNKKSNNPYVVILIEGTKMSKFKAGDIIIYNNDDSRYEVTKVGIWFYGLNYLSFDTHGNSILRTAGTTIDYVDENFRGISKLEKALK